MIRRRLILAMFASGLFAAATFGAPVLANSGGLEQGAREFIESLAKQAVAALTDSKVARKERVARFRRMFDDNFAVEAIGRWILGRHWRNATEAERIEYLRLFEDLMVVSYVDRFAQYAGESLKVEKTQPESESTVTVFSEIVRPNSPEAIRVDWRVGRNKQGAYKIVDVVVEGTSMSNTLRSDFTSVVNQKGGQVAGLLEVLREKTASLKREMGE